MTETATPPRSGRVNMRIAPEQEDLLRAAADAAGQSLTGFVLGASVERAREVLESVNRIEVSSATFEAFVAALEGDDSDEEMPVLRRYASA